MFVCIRYGTFYHIYNRDCYILSYLFGYKIKELNIKDRECGFPITALNKVMAKLEEKKINYLVLDRRNNYEVDYKEDFKNSNQYDILFKKANAGWLILTDIVVCGGLHLLRLTNIPWYNILYDSQMGEIILGGPFQYMVLVYVLCGTMLGSLFEMIMRQYNRIGLGD